MYTADTLSRAPSSNTEEMSTHQEVEAFVDAIVLPSLPAGAERLETYRKAQLQDPECTQVREYCQSGWPTRNALHPNIVPFWKARGALTICNDLLLFNSRIVVPKPLQRETLMKIHSGHQEMVRCNQRLKQSVWWPGVNSQMSQMVQECQVCIKNAKNRREPLMTTPTPDYPWQMVGTDLFDLNGTNYLLVTDYFSRYPEVIKLTSSAVITALKSMFSRHGIPEIVRSDNGPQYSSDLFAKFATSYDFKHVTSSPLFAQSNGQVERMVQTVKRLLKQSDDPYMALMSYHATPLPWCDLSPTELLMGRRIRTSIPQMTNQFVPGWTYISDFKKKDADFKRKQKDNYDD